MSNWKAAITLALNASGAVAGLKAFSGAVGASIAGVGKLKSAIGGVGDVLFKLPQQAAALQGALSSLSLPSRLAGSAETTSVAFRVLIGNAEKSEQVLDRIRVLAAATPFEFPELAGAARMLAAFGEEADSIPDTLKRIGDIAAGTQTPIGELAEMYGKARVAGTLFSEDINQLTGRGIPIIQEFAKQLGVADGEVKKMAESGKITFPMLEKAFSDLTGQGGRFNGMMESIAGTFEGKFSTLTDSINTLMTELGKGINEGLKPVMDELTAQLDSQSGLAKSIGESIGYGIEVGLEAIKSGDGIEFLTEGLKTAAWTFAAAMEKAIKALIPTFSSMVEGVARSIDEDFGDAVKTGMIEAKGLQGYKDDQTWGTSENSFLQTQARDSQSQFADKMSGAMGAVDQRRADKAGDAARDRGLEAYYKAAGPLASRGPEAKAPGTTDVEKSMAEFNAKNEAADLDKWYAEKYGAQTAVPSGAPTPSGVPARSAGRSMQGYSGPSMADAMGEKLAGMGSAGRAQPGAGGRIQGVVSEGSFQYDRRGNKVNLNTRGADRMAAAGTGAARARSAQTSDEGMTRKAAALFIKMFPDLVRDVKTRAAQTP